MNLDILNTISSIKEVGQHLSIALQLLEDCEKKTEHLQFRLLSKTDGGAVTIILVYHVNAFVAKMILTNVSQDEVKLELDKADGSKFATLSIAEMKKKLIDIQKQNKNF